MAWKFKLIALLLTAMSFMPAVLGAITKRNAMNQDMRLGLEIYILQLTPINKYMTTTTELSAILRKEDLIFFLPPKISMTFLQTLVKMTQN